jgi:hypothetical protein
VATKAPTVATGTKADPYAALAHAMTHAQVLQLWKDIQARTTAPTWPAGKALEYLIVRGFELEGTSVVWPFSVRDPETNEELEQIDGVVYAQGLSAVVEAKDFDDRSKVNIEPIAKLRSQLLRRPSGVLGAVFSRTGSRPGVLVMLVNIVVEGETDAELLKAILPELAQKGDVAVWIRASGGISLAQSLLASERGPVALVADADAPPGSEAADERRRSLRHMLAGRGREGVDWNLTLFEPEAEAVLFSKPALLAKLLKRSQSDVSAAKTLAEVAPRRALAQLGVRESERSSWFQKAGLSAFASAPQIAELRRFLKKRGVPPGAKTAVRRTASSRS